MSATATAALVGCLEGGSLPEVDRSPDDFEDASESRIEACEDRYVDEYVGPEEGSAGPIEIEVGTVEEHDDETVRATIDSLIEVSGSSADSRIPMSRASAVRDTRHRGDTALGSHVPAFDLGSLTR
ncbi:hypothetical protein D8Y22_16310 [Salinadaptatus halalkaliphilus]|uniref:Uncharacterized protein n=1 Tax=Salinadaptatus halalkaliphilus TaxID=2419781 RepID=A0A4S3TLL8_9EURY|nr:hypothetical protein [Salinadaptatus halalkaliphilus]THE63885.1 hypothetical protein D8Y22_16310 [Salinadaptatus halalkaliphilus]